MTLGEAARKLGASSVLADALQAHFAGTPLEGAHFLAQLAHESAGFTRFEESFDYSVERLREVFSRTRISDEECRQWGRAPGRRADQEAIANRVYGGLWGRNRLGNTQPGDGWKYRGRGCAQLTGRDNYARCGAALGLDLLAHPDLLLIPEHNARSAVWFWTTKNCAPHAMRDDVETVSRAWNGGTNGLADRIRFLKRAKTLLGVR